MHSIESGGGRRKRGRQGPTDRGGFKGPNDKCGLTTYLRRQPQQLVRRASHIDYYLHDPVLAQLSRLLAKQFSSSPESVKSHDTQEPEQQPDKGKEELYLAFRNNVNGLSKRNRAWTLHVEDSVAGIFSGKRNPEDTPPILMCWPSHRRLSSNNSSYARVLSFLFLTRMSQNSIPNTLYSDPK